MGDYLKNTDLAARSPLYALLPELGDLKQLFRYQGAFFARLDHIRSRLRGDNVLPVKEKTELEAEASMLQVALTYISEDPEHRSVFESSRLSAPSGESDSEIVSPASLLRKGGEDSE